MNRAKIIVIEGSDGSGKKTQAERLVKTSSDLGYKVGSFSFPDYESFFGQTIRDYLNGSYGDFNEFERSFTYLDCFPDKMFPVFQRISGGLAIGPATTIQNLREALEMGRDAHIRFASLLYTLDRLRRLPDLKKSIDENDLVVGDRWDFSNWAHQGAKHDEGIKWEWVSWLIEAERNQFGFPEPDIGFYLSLPNTYRWAAMVGEGRRLDIHERSADYQKRVEKAYMDVAEMEAFDVIDCLKEGWNSENPKPEDRKSVDEIAEEIWNRVKGELPELR